MGFAAGYALDLYCDSAGDYSPGNPSDGVHDFNEFPHTFDGDSFADCARQARARGWRINRRARTALCPKCSRSANGGRAAA